jgi:GAF domain-containing protein
LQAECDFHSLLIDWNRIAQGLASATGSSTELAEAAPARDLKTLVTLPLKSRNRVSGLLALGSSRENAIGDDLMETLYIFVHEAAIVLDNALLYRQLGRTNRELQQTIDELRASQARERALRREVQALKIEIDETKRKKQVAEITETEYFQQLRERARRIRDKEG